MRAHDTDQKPIRVTEIWQIEDWPFDGEVDLSQWGVVLYQRHLIGGHNSACVKIRDLGWHEFILMTQPYQDFCKEYLSGYIHHLPAPLDSTTLQRKKRVQTETYLIRYLSFIEHEIGPRPLARWLTGLPKMRGPE